MSRPDLDWMRDGACVDRLDLPWLVDSARIPRWQLLALRATCAGCLVLSECAAHVATTGVVGGFWAGADRDPHATTTHAVPVQGELPLFEPVAG